MRKSWYAAVRFAAVLELAAGLVLGGAAACRSSGNSASNERKNPGTGQALAPDENGRVDLSKTGTTGIQGAWFAFADTDDCEKGGHAADECSRLILPDPGSASFRPTGELGMCTVGIAAKVVVGADGGMDWGKIFGAGIAFSFQAGNAYDALAHGVTGLAFHIDSEPPPGCGIRIQLAMEGTAKNAPPYWGGRAAPMSPVHAGYNEFRWADVGGPFFLDNPPRFDPTRLVSISFQVPPIPAGATAFGFCISHLTALRN